MELVTVTGAVVIAEGEVAQMLMQRGFVPREAEEQAPENEAADVPQDAAEAEEPAPEEDAGKRPAKAAKSKE